MTDIWMRKYMRTIKPVGKGIQQNSQFIIALRRGRCLPEGPPYRMDWCKALPCQFLPLPRPLQSWQVFTFTLRCKSWVSNKSINCKSEKLPSYLNGHEPILWFSLGHSLVHIRGLKCLDNLCTHSGFKCFNDLCTHSGFSIVFVHLLTFLFSQIIRWVPSTAVHLIICFSFLSTNYLSLASANCTH